MLKKTILILTLVASSALANEPTDYKEKIKNDLMQNLKDPDSLKDLYIGNIVKDTGRNDFLDSQSKDRWVVCVKYNAKNSYGGYGGIGTHLYYFSNNQIMGDLEEEKARRLGVIDPPRYCRD